MALFSLKKIAALAQNRQTYLRGIQLYNAGRVQALTRSQNDFYAEFITADVQGDDEDTFAVEIGMNTAGETEYLYCSCNSFHEDMGACKHIVGVLADKYYKDMLGGMTPAAALHTAREIHTDEIARRLMHSYYERDMAALQGAGDEGDITLTPTLSVSGGRALLSLSVGRERPFVVKDISRFGDAVQNGETLTYGKNFSFFHTPSAFAADSRPLLRFVLAELSAFTHTNRNTIGGRELPLSPGGVDRLLKLYRDRGLSVRTGGAAHTVCVVYADPQLAVTVEKTAGGYIFTTEPAVALVGTAHFYVVAGEKLYTCSTAFANGARDWLIAAAQAEDGLRVSETDMPAFCAKVLCYVEKVLTLTGDDTWRQFLPADLNTRVYLDSPDSGTVTAAVQFCYGDRQIPLFTDARPNERRDLHREWEVRLLIERYFTGFLPETGEVVFHGDDETIYAFLTDGLPQLEALAQVFASDAFKQLRPAPPPQIGIGVNITGDLLEVQIDLERWSKQELAVMLSAFRGHKRFTRLHSGAFVQLDDEMMQGLLQLTDELALTPAELKSGRVTVPRYRALQLQSLLRQHPALRFEQSAVFRNLADTLLSADRRPCTLPPSLKGILRPYQEEGFYWLKTLDAAGFGGILADDMGLGKTLQIISILLDSRAASGLPSLVVCPTSLVLNWLGEIEKFAPSLRVLAVMGDAATRAAKLENSDSYDVLLTSYDLLKRDILLYQDKHFRYHILDEAQNIKNQTTQNARAVKAIISERRFALTGTPMENRLSELWSIFDFLMPGFLYSYTQFKNRFELPIVRDGKKEPLERLSHIIAPFLLRRLKRDVLRDLPPKTEQIIPAGMEKTQEKLYAACAAQAKSEITAEIQAGTFAQKKLSVLTLLMRLRQLCCDPSLCVDGYTGESCKRQMCLDVVQEACDNGHRVLLFSQFTSMLDILKKDLAAAGISHMVLKGSTPAAERARLVADFNSGDTKVFLISLKAGGTGLNLTGADVVIHYDPWWNMAAQQQATDRAYRIGQENPVQVVRLVVKDTIEEKILQLQENKQAVADAVLAGSVTSLSALHPEELLALL